MTSVIARVAFFLILASWLLGVVIQAPAWGAGVSDLIWVETNSTAGNSILTFLNNETGTPTLVATTAAGGIGVFDGTFALGPFDSDQNLIVNPERTPGASCCQAVPKRQDDQVDGIAAPRNQSMSFQRS